MAEYNQIEPLIVTEFSFEWKISDYSINEAYSSKFLLDNKHRVILDLTRGMIDFPDRHRTRGVRSHNLHIYFEDVSARDSKKFFKLTAETKRGNAITSRAYTQLKRGSNSFSIGDRFLDQRFAARCVESEVLTIFIEITLKDFAECRQESKLNFEKAVSSLLTDKTNSDLKIIVNGHTFFVHKAILAARSPAFQKLISDCKGDTLTIESSSCDTFQDIINFIYANRIKTPSIDLTDLAKQYELPDLVTLNESLLNPKQMESVSAALVSQEEKSKPLKRTKPIKKGKKNFSKKNDNTDSTERNENGQMAEAVLCATKGLKVLNNKFTAETFIANFASNQANKFKNENNKICSSEIPKTEKENLDPSNITETNDIAASKHPTVSVIDTTEGGVADRGNESESSECEIIPGDVNVEDAMNSTAVEIEKLCDDGNFSGLSDVDSADDSADDSEDTLVDTSSDESADELMDGPNTTVIQVKENSDAEQDKTLEVDQREVVKVDSTDIIIEDVIVHEADGADQAAMEVNSLKPEADQTQENAPKVELDPQENVKIEDEMIIETAIEDAVDVNEVGEAPIDIDTPEHVPSVASEGKDSKVENDLCGSLVKAEDTATEIEKDEAPMKTVNANPSKKTQPKHGKKNGKGRGKNHKK